MSDSQLDLSAIDAWARSELDRKNEAREQALKWSREMVRACATSIRSLHRHEFERANELLTEANALNERIHSLLASHEDLYWSGYVQDAQKEVVEAAVTLALVRGEPLPDPSSLGVSPAVLLNGLGEAVGELRRFLLDQLRRGEFERGESLLWAMDEIYGLLVTLDYPDALTGGLRRTTDVTRGILEKTRGDWTLALRQEALQRALSAED